jgi:hypothetical protein
VYPADINPSCAFIIVAHRQPRQLLRLIARLAPAPIFLHIDTRAEAQVRHEVLRNADRYPSLTFVAPVRSSWASWGIAEATLRGLRAAHAVDIAHAVVLSGQDYPLVGVEDIHAFSRRHQKESFVASWALPSPLWGREGGMERIRHWHRPVRGRRFRLPFPRRFPPRIKPFGGSANFMLTRAAIGELLDFVRRRSDVQRFYRHAWMPCEMFVHTAVLNSPARESIVDENLWYVDWPSGGIKHPRVLGYADAGALLEAAGRESSAGGWARAKLFARKFDAEVDAAILDVLDQHAAQRGGAVQR